MPFGVIQVDLSGIIVYANPSAIRLIGVKEASDLIGRHYEEGEQFGEDQMPLSSKDHAFYIVLKEGKVVTSNLQGAIVNGQLRWFSINAAPIYDDENNLIGGISNFANVTDKVEGDKKRREEAGRYKILVENINAVVWETKIGTQTFSYISPKASELLGFPKEDWLKEGFWQSRLYEDDKVRVIAYERDKAPDVGSYQLEYRLVHKDGSIVWVRDLVEVVKENGRPDKLRGLILNITERKNSRLLLRESEKRYKQMITEAPYAITIYDRHGTLVAANSKCVDYWLIDPNEYIGVFNIFHNDVFTSEKQKETIRRAFSGEQGEVTAEIPLTHAGEKKTYRIKYYPLFDQDGSLDNVVYFTEDITEFVEAGRKTQREEALKQGILDALDQAILVVDENGIIISTNRNLKSYIEGQLYSELKVGRSVFDFISYFDESYELINGLKSILNHKVKILDHEMKLADGKWYNLRATPLDEPFGAVIAWQNINTRKEIELALERSLKKYRSIYNKAPVMMHSINDKVEIISVSDFWLEKMGYERNEVIGKSPLDFMAKESIAEHEKSLEKLFKDGFVRNTAYKYVKKSGEVMDVLLSAVAEYDEDGKFERSITGMLDVTDLKRAERKLQDSQSKLLEAQRISKIANYEYEVETGYFTPSEEMVSLMGIELSDNHASVIQKVIYPEDLPGFSETLGNAIKQVKDFYHTFRIRHLKTNKIKWISGRGRMQSDGKGWVTKMIGTLQDVTEQKQAELKIKRLTDRILLATEIANLGVWEYDRETDEIFWEDQMYSIFTDAKEPQKLAECQKYLVESDQTVFREGLQMIKDGINFLESEINVMVEGEEKYLRSFIRVLRDQSGKMKGMVGVLYDITLDKTLQKRLEKSLDEKNVLIKEVHHRVKNNMQLISSILALKSYDLETDKSKAIFDEVNNRIKAMSVIHDKLYKFYNVSEIDLSEYLHHIAQELQVLLGSSYIRIDVSSEQIVMDVEKALLIGLMVSEMVGNAIKHGFEKNEEGTITIHFAKQQKKNVLRVVNNGKEVESDVLQSSSGLGISLIKTFAKQLMGSIEVDPENGFKVTF